VRILLVGDDGVGKTSLILSLVTEEFPDEVPSRAEEITIPADVTPEKVPTHIVDFSYSDQTEIELREELGRADVVCVVYAINSDESIGRITTYWLPIVFEVCGREEGKRKPVVLVGNKSDQMEAEGAHLNEIIEIMDEYPEVETCIECSAFELKNISELFYYAQKAVLHPTGPLFSHDEQQLTEKCERSLLRIFKICDMDNDDLLNDVELNEFQKRCFRNSLPSHGLQEVKNIISRNLEGGVTEEGVTINGFLFLHTLFIQKGRQETTWTALRRFGYDDNLELKDDYLYPPLHVDEDCSVELSSSGLDFVMELFYKHDQDEDDALCPEEVTSMISICPQSPWSEENLTASCTNEQGWPTAEGFVAQWILWTYINYKWTLEHLAHFGYVGGDMENQLSGLRVTRSKAVDLQKRKTMRSVFLVYVIGATGTGKTAFLQSFLNRSIKDRAEDAVCSKYAINSVQLRRKEVHIILKEVNLESAPHQLKTGQCDAVCFVFDANDPETFEPVENIVQSKPVETPILFVGMKSDLHSLKKPFEGHLNLVVSRHSPYPIQWFNATDQNTIDRKVFTKIATLATHVYGGSYDSERSYTKLLLGLGITLSAVLAVGFISYRYIRRGGGSSLTS